MKLPKLILSAFLALAVSLPAISAPAAYAVEYENDASAVLSSGYEAADSLEAAAKDLRQHLKNRDASFTVSVDKNVFDWGFPPETVMTDVEKIQTLSLAETGVPTEGDYIRWQLNGYDISFDVFNDICNINFNMRYYTTAEQEKAVDAAVKNILSSLDTGSGTDFEKVRAVYDWLKNEVKYADSTDSDLVYTAYGAAVQKKAVCQGYAILAYRLLTELGVKCRVVPGTGNNENHAWNIAEVDGNYYYFDATWESQANMSDYLFLLRGKDDFDKYAGKNKHIYNNWEHEYSLLYAEYDNGSFEKNYPVSSKAYYELGDLDGNGMIDSVDATNVLTAYSKLSTGSASGLKQNQSIAADVDLSGMVDSKDASRILAYYAYLSTGGNGSMIDYMKNRR